MEMEAVIFMGLQASGKSSFYKERFFRSHIRINLDMLKTRHREKILLQTCLDIGQSFVIDNTNPEISDRQRYIPQIKEHKGITLSGYYFQSEIKKCVERNAQRDKVEIVSKKGVLDVYGRLQLPSYKEGFDHLYYVSIEEGMFGVKEWQDEV